MLVGPKRGVRGRGRPVRRRPPAHGRSCSAGWSSCTRKGFDQVIARRDREGDKALGRLSFNNKPLRTAMHMGFVFFAVAFFHLVWIIAGAPVSRNDIPGYVTIVAASSDGAACSDARNVAFRDRDPRPEVPVLSGALHLSRYRRTSPRQ